MSGYSLYLQQWCACCLWCNSCICSLHGSYFAPVLRSSTVLMAFCISSPPGERTNTSKKTSGFGMLEVKTARKRWVWNSWFCQTCTKGCWARHFQRFGVDSAKDGIGRKWRFGEDSAGDSEIWEYFVWCFIPVMLQVHPSNLQHTQIDWFG